MAGKIQLFGPRQTTNSALKVNRRDDVASSFCNYAPECAPKVGRLDDTISLFSTLNGYSNDDCTNDDC